MASPRPYFLALGFTLLGAIGGHYLWPQTAEKSVHSADGNGDGNVDLIVDNNWRIILTTDQGYIAPADTVDPSYKVCLFPAETVIPNDANTNTLREKARPLLEYCLSH